MKRKESTIKCEDCIHFGACSAWNRGVYLNATAQRCINFERLRDSAVYYIGAREMAKKLAERLKTECFDGGIDDKWVAVSFSRLNEICKELTEGVK